MKRASDCSQLLLGSMQPRSDVASNMPQPQLAMMGTHTQMLSTANW